MKSREVSFSVTLNSEEPAPLRLETTSHKPSCILIPDRVLEGFQPKFSRVCIIYEESEEIFKSLT
ncbi:Cysteine desulfurase [Geitlerinema sp. FC II]|nr:Cysteine desulfurase [Geitlerinema sp. FC II]